MKYIGLFIRVLCTLILLQLSQAAAALELIDAKLPASLQNAYNARYYDPSSCIDDIDQYIAQKRIVGGFQEGSQEESNVRLFYASTTHLQAFCYAQIENYTSALALLELQLNEPAQVFDEITTLSLIALDIPEDQRPQLNNQRLLDKLTDIAEKVDNTRLPKYVKTPNLTAVLQLTIAHLYLKIDRYHDAYLALDKAQIIINTQKNNKLNAWLDYYYGLYYDLINQPQLAIASFLSANKLADQYTFIKLSGEIKSSLADIYQAKHRFQIALDFTSQQIELYNQTKNTIKQTVGLIRYAILKRMNREYNQSLVYLFNALELIQDNKNPSLLARIYLELGHTYLSSPNTLDNNLELAKKYLQNARFHFVHLKETNYQIESLLLLAKLNIINKEPALAILQLEKVLQLSQNRYLPLRVQAFEMLASSYEITGNHQLAIEHFKNFHALQNRIKEDQFELQQLQISEQLQLFENTQQQKQLQIENTQLQSSTYQYKMLAYSAISLLVLITVLFLFSLKRNKKLNDAHTNAQQRLAFHPRTNLPFQHADSNHFQYIYPGTPLYYALLNIPFLSQLNELLGTYGAMKIEKKLGEELIKYFSRNVDIFQFRGNQILFIGKQKDYQDGGDFVQSIEYFFTSFCNRNKLDNVVSCGIVAFPFLNNASRAFSSSRTLNLSSLALFAASQIRQKTQQSSWVELYAIENLQPAFFDGDLWQLGQAAIEKGIVKINTSHPDFLFNWPKQNK